MLQETKTYRILKTNRTEYIILLDEGQDFEYLYKTWCDLDDAFCEGKLQESKWQDIATYLRNNGVTVIEPAEIQILADYYGDY